MTRVTFATEGGVGLQGHRDASTNDRLVATLVIAFHGFHLRLRFIAFSHHALSEARFKPKGKGTL